MPSPIYPSTGGGSSTTTATNKFKPLTVGYAGDSFSVYWSEDAGRSPLFWVNSYLYPCNTKNIFVSGRNGSATSDLITAQIATLEALTEMSDLLIVSSLQNDLVASDFNADTLSDIVIEYCNRALTAGVTNVILNSRAPSDSFNDTPSSVAYLNRTLKNYCDTTNGMTFLDTMSLWRLPPTAEEGAGVGVTWKVGYSADGVHPMPVAVLEQAKELQKIIEPLVQAKVRQQTSAENYDNVTNTYANVVGVDGYMIGTGGQYNGVNNTSVCGSEQDNGIRRWELTDGNGVTATPSIVVGDDGYNYQQLTLGGTATASSYITLQKPIVTPITAGDFVFEGDITLNNVTGLQYLQYNLGFDYVSYLLEDSATLDGDIHIQFATDYYHEGNTSSNAPYVKLFFKVASGSSPTGTIQLGRVGMYRQIPQV